MTKKLFQPALPVKEQRKFRLTRLQGVLLGAWALIMVGVIVLVATGSRQPPYVPEVTGKPSAVIDQTLFDYGTVANNSMVETTFRVKNVGDEQLFIIGEPQVEAVEGCCPPRTTVSQKYLNPGEEATVSMRFSMHAGMDGPHEFQVHVRTTDPDNPDQIVTVLSNWVQQ